MSVDSKQLTFEQIVSGLAHARSKHEEALEELNTWIHIANVYREGHMQSPFYQMCIDFYARKIATLREEEASTYQSMLLWQAMCANLSA